MVRRFRFYHQRDLLPLLYSAVQLGRRHLIRFGAGLLFLQSSEPRFRRDAR